LIAGRCLRSARYACFGRHDGNTRKKGREKGNGEAVSFFSLTPFQLLASVIPNEVRDLPAIDLFVGMSIFAILTFTLQKGLFLQGFSFFALPD